MKSSALGKARQTLEETNEDDLNWRASSTRMVWMDEETLVLVVEHARTSTHPCPGREAYVHVGSLELSGENTGPDVNQSRADCFICRLLAGTACVGALNFVSAGYSLNVGVREASPGKRREGERVPAASYLFQFEWDSAVQNKMYVQLRSNNPRPEVVPEIPQTICNLHIQLAHLETQLESTAQNADRETQMHRNDPE